MVEELESLRGHVEIREPLLGLEAPVPSLDRLRVSAQAIPDD